MKPTVVVCEVLDDLCATHARFTQVPKKIPQAELKRDFIGVRPLTELLANESVVRVIRFFLEHDVEQGLWRNGNETHVTTTMKDDANDLALLYLRQVKLC